MDYGQVWKEKLDEIQEELIGDTKLLNKEMQYWLQIKTNRVLCRNKIQSKEMKTIRCVAAKCFKSNDQIKNDIDTNYLTTEGYKVI